MPTCLYISSLLVAAISVLVGTLFFSEVPKKLGLYRFWGHKDLKMMGMTPATLYGVPWKYTFEELYHQNGGVKKNDLSGQNVIVTGGNAGIGFELAKGCALLNAQVTLACRNPTKCEAAAKRIKEAGGSLVSTLTMDTSSFQSVKDFSEVYIAQNQNKSLDVLFLNAGTAFGDPKQKCVPNSTDGIEYVFQTNYVGHHLLYRLLEPLLQKSKQARIVQTSSAHSFRSFSYKVATNLETLNGCKENYLTATENLSYGQSKLAQVLWVQELTKRLGPNSNIYANAFHPGLVKTEIYDKTVHENNTATWIPTWIRKLIIWMKENQVMWSAEEGALTGLFLAVEKKRLEEQDIRGRYYHPQSEPVMNHSLAKGEDELQKDLWEFSDELVKGFL